MSNDVHETSDMWLIGPGGVLTVTTDSRGVSAEITFPEGILNKVGETGTFRISAIKREVWERDEER